jgi:hypothetical protein
MALLERLHAFLAAEDYETQVELFMMKHCCHFARELDSAAMEQDHESYAIYREYESLVSGIVQSFCDIEHISPDMLEDELEREGAYDRPDLLGAFLRALVATDYPSFLRLILEYSDEASDGEVNDDRPDLFVQGHAMTPVPVLPAGAGYPVAGFGMTVAENL